MKTKDKIQIRELLQQLVRDFGLLQKDGSDCCGITVTQSHIVYELGKSPNISLQTLAEKLIMDTGLLSRQVNKLVELQYILRVPDPNDRRYVLLSLTEIGEAKAEEISNQMLEYLGNIFTHIQEDKHSQVLESLSLLLDAMNKNDGLGSCATR
ncbi:MULTISPECIES: MarR family winged helix-turn-helix transcriptional regulator [Niallia]|uniref:MarR family winged helix-turn-helix transcriptional regulator n=1 Tax=Niallia TaxID=2837506 RepID=UPI001EDC3627|nr:MULTISPECIES: MarR family transcriptional regulator [Niallia]MED4040112.1 MarR family transcriptional regulator [Niallia taxi]UPO91118.1 MarR family transcriptional regulator [Niallia sp. Man26]WOD61341.1 MarR family transcriptional regulator [Niallia taxi]